MQPKGLSSEQQLDGALDEAAVAGQAAKALGITQLVPAIYQDMLQPAAREVGQQLVVVAKAVEVALAPLHLTVWGFDRIKDYLSVSVAQRLADKPPEEIVSPDPLVAGPIVMNMVFAANAPHLREMYARLLARAMHAPKVNEAHPSFTHIIQQLSPAEARILHHIAKSHTAGDTILDECWDQGYGPYPSPLAERWRQLCAECHVSGDALADAFYNNLIRLGILAQQYEAESEYRPQYGSDWGIHGPEAITKSTMILVLTDYGNLFLDVCVREQ